MLENGIIIIQRLILGLMKRCLSIKERLSKRELEKKFTDYGYERTMLASKNTSIIQIKEYALWISEIIKVSEQREEFDFGDMQLKKLPTTIIAMLEGLIVLYLLNSEIYNLEKQSVCTIQRILDGIKRKKNM